MIDYAPLVAAYLIERLAAGIEPGAVWVEMRERWPDLTVADADRGAQIAEEVVATEIAQDEAQNGAEEAAGPRAGARSVPALKRERS